MDTLRELFAFLRRPSFLGRTPDPALAKLRVVATLIGVGLILDVIGIAITFWLDWESSRAVTIGGLDTLKLGLVAILIAPILEEIAFRGPLRTMHLGAWIVSATVLSFLYLGDGFAKGGWWWVGPPVLV